MLMINVLEMMAARHAVHKRQGILLTMVVIFHTSCMKSEKELTSEGCGNHHMIYFASLELNLYNCPNYIETSFKKGQNHQLWVFKVIINTVKKIFSLITKINSEVVEVLQGLSEI